MNRETCVFYASWLEAVETMPEAAQGEALKAILTYALRGEEAAKQGAMTKMLMAMVRPIIEANNKRYENGCKGGRPKQEKPNHNQTETKTKPNHNQTETKTKPNHNQTITKPKPKRNQTETTSAIRLGDNVNVNVNVNDNDNDNDNVNDSVCDKSHKTHAHTHEEIFEKFKIQCQAVAPLALEFREPLTVEQFAKLYDTYGWQKVAQCATELHNKEANKKNRRAYTAWQAFITKIS